MLDLEDAIECNEVKIQIDSDLGSCNAGLGQVAPTRQGKPCTCDTSPEGFTHDLTQSKNNFGELQIDMTKLTTLHQRLRPTRRGCA